MRIIRNIIRVIQYIPVIWNNYDWDGGYLLELMLYKLKRMKKCLKGGHSVDEVIEKQQRQLDFSIGLLDRIIEGPTI